MGIVSSFFAPLYNFNPLCAGMRKAGMRPDFFFVLYFVVGIDV